VIRYAAKEAVEVVVTDSDAIAVISSDAGKVGDDFSNRPEIVATLELGDPQTGERFSTTLGKDLFYVAVPVLSGNKRVGAIRITALNEVVSERVASRIRGLLVVALLSLLIASAVAWLLARSVAKPLRRLEAATDRLAGGDLSARADDEGGPGEVRALAGSFNSMASRLEQLVERQRAFAGTASHQLRTPLTALRLRLEQLSAEVADEPEALDRVERALEETDRLHRMIEGLLALTRAEDAAAGPVSVDLSAAVLERAAHWGPLADEQQVAVETEVPPGASVLAVPGAVEQIIDNLVDNALEVSPPGSRLVLSVVPDGAITEFHVIDEGPGLPPAERALAFERFWRAEDAPVGGSGLGLAIVHQLVAAGDGTADLRAAPTGGIEAVVRFRTADRGLRAP
jgi:signal transduction histidine kinase